MQLKNSIYKIIGKEDESGVVDYTIQLIPSCFIYQAHFPGEPITPGVCIVQIGKELVEDLLTEQTSHSQPLEIIKVKNVKFLSIISPNEAKQLVCQIKKMELSEDKTKIEAQVVVLSEHKAMAKISLVILLTIMGEP